MPTVPDWLVPILKEFPVLVAAVAIAAFLVQYLRRQQVGELERCRQDIESLRRERAADLARYDANIALAGQRHEAEIERMRADHREHVRSKNAEIRRLTARRDADRGVKGEDR